MTEITLVSRGAEETRALGQTVARYLKPGSILGLEGALGSGKTTLIQGICAGLGVSEKVASPTFVLLHIYQGKIPVYHFDLYRLEVKDFEDLGWEEYLESNGVSLLEWIDRAMGHFPFPYLHVTLSYGENPDWRTLSFRPEQGALAPWLQELAARAP